MAYREYTGARYVPIFGRKGETSVEWDNSAPYEPLTVVTHQGNSYISRQYVPTGIAITNVNYWVESGNYNAQIEAYREEVLRFDGRISDNEGAIEDINTELDAIDVAGWVTADRIAAGAVTAGKIADGAVTAGKIANGAITPEKLAASLDPYDYFKGYNVVFIGDSYTYGTGASDHLDGDTKRFSTLLANKLQATEFNYGVGSTGFCDPGSGGQNAPFNTQITNAANGMTASEKTNTHLVVIAGGVNDFNEGTAYSASDMQVASHNCMVNALTNFPNAIILLVPMLFKGNGANARLIHFENSLIQGITYYNNTRRCVYIQGAWTWNFGRPSHFISDNLHPNDLGHQVIASMIYAHILGGVAYDNCLVTPTWESGYYVTAADGGYFQFFNGVMQGYGMYLTLSTALVADQQAKIGSIAFKPTVSVTGIIMKGSHMVGVWQITAGGNIYVCTTNNYSSGEQLFLAPISWIPSGY